MVMQREYAGVYPSSGKEGPTSSGEERVLYFLAPKCLRRGYKLREREPVPSLKERVQWSIAWDVDLSSEVVSCGFRPFSSVVL
jgi:hypothetical protein